MSRRAKQLGEIKRLELNEHMYCSISRKASVYPMLTLGQTAGMLTRTGQSEAEARDIAKVIKTPNMSACVPT